jgi:hypothetical protein
MSPVSWAAVLLSFSTLLASASPDAPPYEIDLADVSKATDACPSQDQLAEALEARMPGVVARGAHEPSPNQLRLALTLSLEGVARVTMIDATGVLRLERDLDLPKSGAAREPRDHAGGCPALAETVALIVERYMRHLGYHEPPPPALVEPTPPPPPPPLPPPAPPVERLGAPVRVGLGVAARPPYQASWRVEPQLTAAARFGRLDVGAAAGVALSVTESVPMSATKGTLTLRTFPARLAIGWIVPVGARLSLLPGVGGGFDVVLAETRGIDTTRRSTALEPTLEVGMRAVAAVTHRVWIDLQAFEGIDVRPEQFSINIVGSSASETVFTTPRTYTRVGVDFGVYLGKN